MSGKIFEESKISVILFAQANDFTRHYISAALELMDDEDKKTVDAEPGRIHPDSIDRMMKDCTEFLRIHEGHIEDSKEYVIEKCSGGWNAFEIAGTDFWLNRCGHGAGFWDGDWPEPFASMMDATCSEFGEQYLIVGDDGFIHAEGGVTNSIKATYS